MYHVLSIITSKQIELERFLRVLLCGSKLQWCSKEAPYFFNVGKKVKKGLKSAATKQEQNIINRSVQILTLFSSQLSRSDMKLILQYGLVHEREPLLNKLNQIVPVGQVLQEIHEASKPDQSGLSSSIRLEVMCLRTFCNFFFLPWLV